MTSRKHDLHIPKDELHCKCPGSVSLLSCMVCFHQDSQLCLGTGSFASAYYALWMGIPVALKHFNRRRKGKSDIEDSFGRELNILKRIRHPNIICLYGYDVEELYFVLEVARKGCLADFITSNKFKNFEHVVWPLHARIALEFVSAVNFLHERDIVHGDLKSFNILLDSNYTVKIADFGTSFILGEGNNGEESQNSGSSGEKEVKNDVEDELATKSAFVTHKKSNMPLSVAWASPARLRGEGPSIFGDIYSVGVVLWELVALELPYNNFKRSAQKLAAQVVHAGLRPSTKKLDGYRLPELYITVVKRCWEGEVPSLVSAYKGILEVNSSWKCVGCGFWNIQSATECCMCQFDPFSPSDVLSFANKTKSEAGDGTESDPGNLNTWIENKYRGVNSTASSTQSSSVLTAVSKNDAVEKSNQRSQVLPSSSMANISRIVTFDVPEEEVKVSKVKISRPESPRPAMTNSNNKLYNVTSIATAPRGPKADGDPTAVNTAFNTSLSEVVELVSQSENMKKFEYSKFKGSCVVKKCNTCSFKDACSLKTHKNIHNQAGDYAECDDSEGASRSSGEALSASPWECDLCFTMNDVDVTECSNCFCSKP